MEVVIANVDLSYVQDGRSTMRRLKYMKMVFERVEKLLKFGG